MNLLIFEIVVYLLEAFISAIFFVSVLESKYKKIIQIFIWCSIVFGVMLFTPSFSFIRIGVITMFEVVYVLLLYTDTLKRKALCFVFKEFMALCGAGISFLVFSIFTKNNVGLFSGYSDNDFSYSLLYLLIFSLFVSAANQIFNNIRGTDLLWIVCMQLVIFFGESLAVLSVIDITVNADINGFFVASAACMVISNVFIGKLYPYLHGKFSLSNSIDYGKELNNMEYKYYEKAVENDKKIMEIRHDIANHIQTIYALLENGDNKRGLEIVDELKDKYTHIDQLVYCKNPVINIILTNKKSEAESKGIETFFKVKDDLNNIPITDLDLSTVICNLLDNAIRGCLVSEQSHPRLVVEILQKNQYLVIRILNSCKVSMNFENTDRIDSTKSKSQTHGLGMIIVSGIAKKYCGDFMVSAQNGLFTATVIMSLK